MNIELRAVNDFFKMMHKLHIVAYESDDNKVIDQCTLDGIRLWRRLTEREKKIALGTAKDEIIIAMLTSWSKYNSDQLERYEKFIIEEQLWKYNNHEEWITAQGNKANE